MVPINGVPIPRSRSVMLGPLSALSLVSRRILCKPEAAQNCKHIRQADAWPHNLKHAVGCAGEVYDGRSSTVLAQHACAL